jgi:hypothetical protein
MKKQNLLKRFGVILLMLLFIAIGSGCQINKNSTSDVTPPATQSNHIAYSGVDGKNAFELLQAQHKITSTSSDFGAFVTEIDGVKNSTDKFWMFYINGTLAQSAPDKYITKQSDQIEWKYEKSPQ